MVTEKTFDTGELVLNYSESDIADAPPMVLLHGLTGHSAHMFGLPDLQDEWHVYAPDLRGHGKSGRAADNDYTVGAYARDIIAFLKHVVKAPAVVMGHSLGALTTIGTAAGYPAGVRAAVLLDPPLYTWIEPGGIDIDPNTKQYFQVVYTLRSSSLSDETMLAQARQMMPPDASDEMVREWVDTLAGVALGTVQAVMEKRLWGDLDLGEALDSIECPTLMIHGDWEQGAAVREQDVAFFMAHTPDAAVVRMPETDHGLKMNGQPELMLQPVKVFLQTL